MTGPLHKQFSIPWSIMLVSILIGILGFGLEYLFIVPIGYYFSVWCDIDQNQYAPRETRRAKALWETLLWLIPLISFIILAYFGYNYFNKIPITKENYKYIGLAGGVFITSILLNIFLKSSYGTFFRKHRGFTHTLIIPILLIILYTQLGKMNVEPKYTIIIKVVSILIAGLFAGLTSHIFIDCTCRMGCPILWPLYKGNIHWGNAITSDPKRPGNPHKSSIRVTYLWSIICIIITVIICFVYRTNFLLYLPKFPH